MVINLGSKRRWFRYSLRSLLLLVTLAAVPLAWLGNEMHRVRVQRQVVQGIEASNGSVGYEDPIEMREPQSVAQMRMSRRAFFTPAIDWKKELPISGRVKWWLRDHLDADLFQTCTTVILSNPLNPNSYDAPFLPISHSTMEMISLLPKLKKLDLGRTHINGDQLRHIQGLSEIEELVLWETDVTDEALVYLHGLKRLKSLNLGDTRITDVGLSHLQSLTELEALSVWSTDITDAGLVHLHGMKSLKFLALLNTKVTEARCKKLIAVLPHLKIHPPELVESP